MKETLTQVEFFAFVEKKNGGRKGKGSKRMPFVRTPSSAQPNTWSPSEELT